MRHEEPGKASNTKQVTQANSFCVWDTTVNFDYPSSDGYDSTYGTGNMFYYFSSPSPVNDVQRYVHSDYYINFQLLCIYYLTSCHAFLTQVLGVQRTHPIPIRNLRRICSEGHSRNAIFVRSKFNKFFELVFLFY